MLSRLLHAMHTVQQCLALNGRLISSASACSNGRVTSPIHDEYDRRAYERLRDELSRGPSAIRRASGLVGGAVGSTAQAVSRRLPPSINDGAEESLRLAFS